MTLGQFNLDPNRTVDVILEGFEHNLQRRQLYVGILKTFKMHRDELRNLLVTKFEFCQVSCQVENASADRILEVQQPGNARLAGPSRVGALPGGPHRPASALHNGRLQTLCFPWKKKNDNET